MIKQQQKISVTKATGQQQRAAIPPADKTMEVVVGKGRRSSVSGSARSHSNQTPTGSRGQLPPQTPGGSRPRSAVAKSAASGSFACANCPKRYSNKKDLDIHGMYCT